MHGPGLWGIIIVAVVVIVLFGRGKISEMMGDMAKGIKAFKKGLSEDETASAEPTRSEPKTIDHQPASSMRDETEKKKVG